MEAEFKAGLTPESGPMFKPKNMNVFLLFLCSMKWKYFFSRLTN